MKHLHFTVRNILFLVKLRNLKGTCCSKQFCYAKCHEILLYMQIVKPSIIREMLLSASKVVRWFIALKVIISHIM